MTRQSCKCKRLVCIGSTRKLGRTFALAFLLALVFDQRAGACAATGNDSPQFPLHVEPGKRYLIDAKNHPFLIDGDAAWSLIAQLTREEANYYLEDRKSRGFNAILVNLLEHKFATNAPANIYGDRPFRKESDFTTPNESYFKHADWIIERACELGFVVLLTPAYAGHEGGLEGWYREVEQNGAAKLEIFGRYLGNRYRNFSNIIWVQGGDYNPPDRELYRALAKGISETDPGSLQTAHNSPGYAALDYWSIEPWLSINSVYTYGSIFSASRDQYRKSPVMPFFLVESAYENEHGVNARRLRQQAYQAILSGAAGQVFGNNPIWHFSGPGLFPVAMTWQDALDSPGSRSMATLFRIMGSRKWWQLIPDIDNSFLFSGADAEDGHAVAAVAHDGSSALVYVPSRRKIGVDLSQLSGKFVTAQWIDPTNGNAIDRMEVGNKLGKQTFVPPETNNSGYDDWLLELKAFHDGSARQ